MRTGRWRRGARSFKFPRALPTVADVRGGAAATIGAWPWADAICFAGGSLLGLEAVGGVIARLHEEQQPSARRARLVSGAIIWDRWSASVYPDHALGRAAAAVTRPGLFPLGRRGVGRTAGCGGVIERSRAEWTGQGAAFAQVGPVKVAVFCVVNALGAVFDRKGAIVAGNRDEASGTRRDPAQDLITRAKAGEPTSPPTGNTTLTLLVTDQKIEIEGGVSLTQVARQVHASMARAIRPFHTPMDGDVLYACTTGEVEYPDLHPVALGAVASELVWDAVLAIWPESGRP
jgi:6-aminohexanoate-oligomer endohydrolase